LIGWGPPASPWSLPWDAFHTWSWLHVWSTSTWGEASMSDFPNPPNPWGVTHRPTDRPRLGWLGRGRLGGWEGGEGGEEEEHYRSSTGALQEEEHYRSSTGALQEEKPYRSSTGALQVCRDLAPGPPQDHLRTTPRSLQDHSQDHHHQDQHQDHSKYRP
jgi:hypothetical protein